jgi:hypothetical protein
MSHKSVKIKNVCGITPVNIFFLKLPRYNQSFICHEKNSDPDIVAALLFSFR